MNAHEKRAKALADLAEANAELHANPKPGVPGAAKQARLAEHAARRARGETNLELDLDEDEFPR